MFYSASTGGFYCTEIHGDNMPTGVVEITTEQHTALINGQMDGKIIKADDNGFPTLTVHVPTQEDLESTERSWRDSELIRADIELYKVQDSDPKAVGTVTQWREYRKALRAWPEHKDFPNKEKRPVSPDA